MILIGIMMNKFKCKNCHKTLLFYPSDINVSDRSVDSIKFDIKCPKCGCINEIKLNKVEKEQISDILVK